MKTIETTQVINAATEKVWNALFNNYGDIYLHHPGIIESHNMNGATKGALGCTRYCKFDGDTFVEEEITEVHENKSFTVTVTKSSFPPAVQELYAIYEVASLGDDKSEVKMTLNIVTDPAPMAEGIADQMQEPIGFYLIGLKSNVETGIAVTMENFPSIMQTLAETSKS